MKKPKAFIASSVEGINVAYALQTLMERDVECTVWDQGVISSLISMLFDFIMEWGYSDFSWGLQVCALVVNLFYLPLLVWYSRKHFRLLHALITITMQGLFELISSLICAALPGGFNKSLGFYCIKFIVVAAVLTTILIYHNKFYTQNFVLGDLFEMIPKRIYVFAFLSMFIETGIITILCYEEFYSREKIYLTKILFFVLTAINAVIMVTLITNVLYKKYYGDLNKMLKQQVDSQLRHYEKREELNMKMRSFRHDFNDHIKCLEAMMTMEKYDEAKTYLRSLSGMMPSGEFLFRTGNYIADAVLTEIQEMNKNVTVKFQGFIPQNIDGADLCTVLSNAMNNAAEACFGLAEGGVIYVYGDCRQGGSFLS